MSWVLVVVQMSLMVGTMGGYVAFWLETLCYCNSSSTKCQCLQERPLQSLTWDTDLALLASEQKQKIGLRVPPVTAENLSQFLHNSPLWHLVSPILQTFKFKCYVVEI